MTQYLLDMQGGLTRVLAETTASNTDRYLHGPRGIYAIEDNSGDWTWLAQDGLGSVRARIDHTLMVDGSQNYAPYGAPLDTQGDLGSFGFTGEQTDPTGQVYLRARYYSPNNGVFTTLDPFEGMIQRPMSLNGYSWVEGNVINKIDPTGMQQASPQDLANRCHRECTYNPCSWDHHTIIGYDEGGNPIREAGQPRECQNFSAGRDPKVAQCISTCFSYLSDGTPINWPNIDLSDLCGLPFTLVVADATSAARNPVGVIGGASRTGNPYITVGAIVSVGFGIIAILMTSGTAADTADTNEPDDDDDDCDGLQPPSLTVAQTVGDVGDIRPTQIEVAVDTVLYYACEILKGGVFSADYRQSTNTRNLDDGTHRFVAYRYLGQMIPSLIDVGPAFGPYVEWEEVTWDKIRRDNRWTGNRDYNQVP